MIFWTIFITGFLCCIPIFARNFKADNALMPTWFSWMASFFMSACIWVVAGMAYVLISNMALEAFAVPDVANCDTWTLKELTDQELLPGDFKHDQYVIHAVTGDEADDRSPNGYTFITYIDEHDVDGTIHQSNDANTYVFIRNDVTVPYVRHFSYYLSSTMKLFTVQIFSKEQYEIYLPDRDMIVNNYIYATY